MNLPSGGINGAQPALVAFVDGNSKDPDTRFGCDAECTAKAFAERLVGQLSHGGYRLADGNYDTSYAYDAASVRDYQMVVSYRKNKNPGSGKHYQGPHRLISIQVTRSDFGKALYPAHTSIERWFGNATSFGGGLAALRAWVRGLECVQTWVRTKFLINAVRISCI